MDESDVTKAVGERGMKREKRGMKREERDEERREG